MRDDTSFCGVCGAARASERPMPAPGGPAAQAMPTEQPIEPGQAPEPLSATEQSQELDTELVDPVVTAVEQALTTSRQGSVIGRLVLFVVSLVLFFIYAKMGNTHTGAVILVVVVLIHELGHWLGMRLLGYRNTSIMFIPFFGAAASGVDPQPSGIKHAIVSLCGPVPGILLAIACGAAYYATGQPVLRQSMHMLFFLNLLNLLPMYPLDGGQVLEGTVFRRFYMADIVFRVVMGLLLAGCAVLLQWKGLFVLVFFVFTSLPSRNRIGQVAEALRGMIPVADRANASRVPRQWLIQIIAMLQARMKRPSTAVAMLASECRAVWERLCFHEPALWATALLLAFYVGMMVMGTIAWVVFTVFSR
jgi:Zn-dependent protease